MSILEPRCTTYMPSRGRMLISARVTTGQRKSLLGLVAHVFWYSELALFAAASVAFVLTLFRGVSIRSVGALRVMAITFASGACYAIRVPDIDLAEFYSARAHGEILLMTDVATGKVAAVETCLRHHHPAAVAGGTSWTINALGL